MVRLLIGKRYCAIGRLGEGMFGQVFLCRNKYNNKVVAVKVARNTDTLKRESQFYRLLRDVECVPRLLWFGTEGKFVFMVLPYCGRELGADLALGLALLVRIARTLIDALAHIHALGITHCDIKPANIVVHEKTKAPMIIDFGLARLGEPPAGKPRKVIGSEMYCSRRVLERNYPAPADDMEALGLSMVFHGCASLTLTERENRLGGLRNTRESDFFGILRAGVHATDYSALKHALEATLTELQLGLKV